MDIGSLALALGTALVAMATLLGLVAGARVAWANRGRSGDSWWRRLLRRTGIALGAAAVALGLVAPVVSAYVSG